MSVKSLSSDAGLSRRSVLATLSGSVAAVALARTAWAQDVAPTADTPEVSAPVPEVMPEPVAEPIGPQPFSFDWLDARMAQASQSDYQAPVAAPEVITDLDYDDYRKIQFNPTRARWRNEGVLFQVHAFHPGWLYKDTVTIHEVVDGMQTPMAFSTDDFLYYEDLAARVSPHVALPGVAGFRLNTPLNRADKFDELVAFVGASYFRALARDSSYGLSARGLAINTGLGGEEEFPRFTEFWLERPAAGQETVVFYAALESPSCTGAYRFVIRPGEETVIDVTAKLHFRRDVEQLGVAALTSMFLFDEKNSDAFDDYRPQVHDSNALMVVRRDGDVLWRPLNNPPRLASSYLSEPNLKSFGLIQRDRAFEDYQDAGAHYQDRPSVLIEPQGDWGPGAIRLVEIPSDLEGNDNIVSFWVPSEKPKAGEAREYAYRLRWGALGTDRDGDRAWIVNTLAGHGGTSGVSGTKVSLRKFVIDFDGGLMAGLPADAEMEPVVTLSHGKIQHIALSKIENTTRWRLVIDVDGGNERLVELVAHVAGFGRKLTETWIYQWVRT
ncbi:glucans biosynthesis protein [Celeribacter baekdonensis]|jgi:glucans biosynthesis protein|uniref:Glucans biosynthesis protein n=1 Tax=Celeribacter baekdonensis TaxID=875171 RepID=A0A1G7TP57_9RHOB|nr:glucan biosynthesis protein G [Celeribacter baekdonensis]SDG36794.1 glucans biosynthesis protein [Celeribacter baekdonensis]